MREQALLEGTLPVHGSTGYGEGTVRIAHDGEIVTCTEIMPEPPLLNGEEDIPILRKNAPLLKSCYQVF